MYFGKVSIFRPQESLSNTPREQSIGKRKPTLVNLYSRSFQRYEKLSTVLWPNFNGLSRTR